jgi:hypothetical protein
MKESELKDDTSFQKLLAEYNYNNKRNKAEINCHKIYDPSKNKIKKKVSFAENVPRTKPANTTSGKELQWLIEDTEKKENNLTNPTKRISAPAKRSVWG